jgi:hypothetical protein
MIPVQWRLMDSLIALTGDTVFSLQQTLLFILLNDFALLTLLIGAFVGVFAAISVSGGNDD